MDNKPFIVTPIMDNGNAMIYVQKHPSCDRLTMVRSHLVLHFHPFLRFYGQIQQVSLGMVYLHSKNIVHGDLKAVLCLSYNLLFYLTNFRQQNVLIDDGGRALLCDFGLARVKADIMSRSTIVDVTTMAGSRHWMAPEQLVGESLRNGPSDVYAFGCTSYEVSWTGQYKTYDVW